MSRKHSSIPSGVRSMAWSRTMRYIGWGFGESLIPVFIMSVAGSYAAAGLVRSTYDIAVLLVLPLLGHLAERYSARWFVIAGLLLYPLVGISYFLAGTTGILAYIVVARAINGIAWGLDATGIDTYFRRLTPSASIASSFGFLDMLPECGWILAAISGIWLVRYFTVPELLLLIAPFALLSLPFVFHARRDHPALGHEARKVPLRSAYINALKEWREWSTDLRLLGFLLLFVEAITVLIDFFVPITIYQDSNNLSLVIVFMVISGVPPIFGYVLGRFADKHNKPRLVVAACIIMALTLLVLTLSLPYLFVVSAGLALGVLLELLLILQRSIGTALVSATHYGRLDSIFSIIGSIGDLAAPPILGAALMVMGLPTLAAILSAIALLFALIFIMRSHPHHGFTFPSPSSLGALIPPPEHQI